MIRKCHNHILLTNPRHNDEKPKNCHSDKPFRTQQKQSNQLSHSQRNACKKDCTQSTAKRSKYLTIKTRQIMGQQQNNGFRMDSSRS